MLTLAHKCFACLQDSSCSEPDTSSTAQSPQPFARPAMLKSKKWLYFTNVRNTYHALPLSHLPLPSQQIERMILQISFAAILSLLLPDPLLPLLERCLGFPCSSQQVNTQISLASSWFSCFFSWNLQQFPLLDHKSEYREFRCVIIFLILNWSPLSPPLVDREWKHCNFLWMPQIEVRSALPSRNQNKDSPWIPFWISLQSAIPSPLCNTFLSRNCDSQKRGCRALNVPYLLPFLAISLAQWPSKAEKQSFESAFSCSLSLTLTLQIKVSI